LVNVVAVIETRHPAWVPLASLTVATWSPGLVSTTVWVAPFNREVHASVAGVVNVKLPGVTDSVPVAVQVEILEVPHETAPAGPDDSAIEAPVIPPMSANGATAATNFRDSKDFVIVPFRPGEILARPDARAANIKDSLESLEIKPSETDVRGRWQQYCSNQIIAIYF
jgi:hypothetical protein